MDQQSINIIEAYINGSLDEEASKKFEADMAEDEELAEVYHEHMLAMDAVDLQEEKELHEKFDLWEKDGQNTPHRTLWPTYLKIAAAVALLVSFYFLFFNKNNSPELNTTLAIEYYITPESPGNTMGRGDALWSDGLINYENGTYSEAIQVWEEIENPSPEMQYFLAHAYFNIKELMKASEIFKDLSNGNSAYSFPAEWYLLLTYLATGEKDNFDQLATVILDNQDHPYHQDVVDLTNSNIKWESDAK